MEAARGKHFRNKQAGEDAVFLRNVAANGESRAFLAAQRDLILPNQLPDIFETHRRLVDGLPVRSCRRVDHLSGCHAARRRHVPFAGVDQIIVDERQNKIGLDPGAVAIHDRSGPRRRRLPGVAFDDHCFAKRGEIFFETSGPVPKRQRGRSLIAAQKRRGPQACGPDSPPAAAEHLHETDSAAYRSGPVPRAASDNFREG